MKLSAAGFASISELSIKVGEKPSGSGNYETNWVDAPAGCSDAYCSSDFRMISVHCPGNARAEVQVSNVSNVSETDTTHWHTVGTGEFIVIDFPIKWLRVSGVSAGDMIYIQRFYHNM